MQRVQRRARRWRQWPSQDITRHNDSGRNEHNDGGNGDRRDLTRHNNAERDDGGAQGITSAAERHQMPASIYMPVVRPSRRIRDEDYLSTVQSQVAKPAQVCLKSSQAEKEGKDSYPHHPQSALRSSALWGLRWLLHFTPSTPLSPSLALALRSPTPSSASFHRP
jgi:hypothetical protein